MKEIGEGVSSLTLVVALLGFEPSPSPNVNPLECSPWLSYRAVVECVLSPIVGSSFIYTYTHIFNAIM